jgi:hypothetical protein
MTDRVAGGYCYRWVVTLTDTASRRSSITSGAILVDTSAPRAPSVDLAEPGKTAFDLSSAGVDAAYLGHSGMVWVRGGATGHIDLSVTGFDADSGVAKNDATIDERSGWRATWVGSSTLGTLRISFTPRAEDATLDITTTNGAGLTSAPATGLLVPDAAAPSSVEWRSLPTDQQFSTKSTAAYLSWTGGADDGAGLADEHWVVRYRAPLEAGGECRPASFAADGAARIVRNNTTDTGLQPGSCYVWGVRTLDNVGNAAPINWSAWVVVVAARP